MICSGVAASVFPNDMVLQAKSIIVVATLVLPLHTLAFHLALSSRVRENVLANVCEMTSLYCLA